MTCKTFNFELFGVKYRTTHFPAIQAMELIDNDRMVDPTEILEKTEAFDEATKQWVNISDEAEINRMVVDKADILSPLIVLRLVMDYVSKYNFAFLKDWNAVKIPRRFLGDAKTVRSEYSQPMFSHLIAEGLASLKELEGYYSLQDSFKLFDILMTKNVNAAYANEANQLAAQQKR